MRVFSLITEAILLLFLLVGCQKAAAPTGITIRHPYRAHGPFCRSGFRTGTVTSLVQPPYFL